MNDNEPKIREALDSIEPEEGARDRMLANILRKAQEEKTNASAVTTGAEEIMTRTSKISRLARWALPVAACLTIVILAAIKLNGAGKKPATTPTTTVTPYTAGNENDPTGTAGSSYPDSLTTYESAAELKAATGFGIDAPQGSEDVIYASFGTEIAEVSFTVDSKQFALRASRRKDDFSGLSGEVFSSAMLDGATDATMYVVRDGNTDFYKAVWNDPNDNDVCYILTNADSAGLQAMMNVFRSVWSVQ
ncbi:MAG: hypothetical protein IK055_02195 [Lachnospiraceae bacterium]|nr:hypothetical protein [Lachnospiraceae bacterium]